MAEEIKACPMCGQPAKPRSMSNGFLQCSNPKCAMRLQVWSYMRWQHRPIEDSLRAQFAAAHKELAELSEVVGKLPKTADGVPVTPGMKVWHCVDHNYGPKGTDQKFPDVNGIDARMSRPYCCGNKCWDHGCQSDPGSGTKREWSECYSTREAAQSALSKGARG